MADPRKSLAQQAVRGDEEALNTLILFSTSEEMRDMSPMDWAKRLAGELPDDRPPAGTPLDPNREMQNLSMGYDPDHPSIEEDPGMKTDPYPDDPDWDLALDAQHRRDNRPYNPTPGHQLVSLARQAKDGSEAAMEDLLLQTDPTEMGRMNPEQWVDHLLSTHKPEQKAKGAPQ